MIKMSDEEIVKKARKLGIDPEIDAWGNKTLDSTDWNGAYVRNIASRLGMNPSHFNKNDIADILNGDPEELKKRLEANGGLPSSNNNPTPKPSQNAVNRGLNAATRGNWNKMRNAPIVGGVAKKAEDKLANKFGNTRLGKKIDNNQQNGAGSQKLKNSLANRARNLMQSRKKKNANNNESSGSESTGENTNSITDDSALSDEAIKARIKRKLIIRISIAAIIAFGFYVFFMIIATVVSGGKSFQAGPFIASSTYNTDKFESVTKDDSNLHEDELSYYEKLQEIQSNAENNVNVNYVNAILMQLYYEPSFEITEEFEETGGIDYKTATNLIDKVVETIKGADSIDYSVDGDIYNALKNSEDLKEYYKKVLENEKIEDVVARAFELAEELEDELNSQIGADDTVISPETTVTVIESKKETGTKTETKTKTLTVNEYIADSIYAKSLSIDNSEANKAYTIAYSTNLASQNNKLSIDSSNVSASNSLCSVSLGCSYDVDDNLVSGGGEQSTKNTYFYKGQYYYKKPLDTEEISSLNKDINSVFGNVLVNSDGTYPDLDIEKLNGLGDNYKTILSSSYGNLTYKNIGEDSYILDGSYGTKQVKTSVIFYDQNDYSSYNFCGKKNETIKTSGCGPTSMAIIVSTYENNKKYDPVYMTSEARKTGYCGGGITGTSTGFFKKEANTMKYKYYKASKYSKKDLNLVLQHLSQGHLVIAHMSAGHFTSGGHYMVLGGVDPETKKVYVYDPYNKVNKSYRSTGSGWYSFNDIIVKEAWNFYIIWKG